MADVIRQFLPPLLAMNKRKMLAHHRKTLDAIQKCRTAELGGHLDQCNDCGHLKISYNSCRNRNCPKCQGVNKESWIVQQEDMLLPVAYFHVVFTLPHELNSLCLYQPKFMYNLLFQAAWHTLKTLANDPKWIGAKTAATMLLHTWSQTMILHPHVHCIVPNGGVTEDGNTFRWQFPKRGKSNFLFPVPAMNKIFKGFFMASLKTKIESGELSLPPDFPFGNEYKIWKNNLYKKDWVVYTKKPFGGVKKVVNYLARYSHRVALTNHRIKNIENGNVIFEYKDYKDGAKKKLMTLKGTEFLRRFCLHILPHGFRKIRQFGFLANACKAKLLTIARLALGEKTKTLLTRNERKRIALKRIFGERTNRCPCCKKGEMVTIHNWDAPSKNKDPPMPRGGSPILF
jgi:hypothetical protein